MPLNGAEGREIVPLDRNAGNGFPRCRPAAGRARVSHHRPSIAGTRYHRGRCRRQSAECLRIAGESLRSPVYSSAGYLLYSRETTNPGIWAVRFSLSRLAAEGEPILVARWRRNTKSGGGRHAGSRQAVRSACRARLHRSPGIGDADQDCLGLRKSSVGIVRRLASARRHPRIDSSSPSCSGVGGGEDLFTYDTVRRTATRVSQGTGAGANPTWSADGQSNLFCQLRRSAGSGTSTAVSSTESSRRSAFSRPLTRCSGHAASRQTDSLMLYAQGIDATTDLWVASLNGNAAPQRLTNTPFREMDGKFSPDGRWIAYTSTESGRSGGLHPIVSDRLGPHSRFRLVAGRCSRVVLRWPGDHLSWRRIDVLGQVDEKRLRWPRGLATTTTVPQFSDPRVLPHYAIAADGQRFIFLRSTGVDRVSVVLNWTALANER